MEIAIGILASLILLTYVIYPAIALLISNFVDDLPLPTALPDGRIFLFMSAHNEADVIREKMVSIVQSDYPKDRLFCYIGLDNCSDHTANIVEEFNGQLQINIHISGNRMGKPSMVNAMVRAAKQEHELSSADLFLMTDANVMFKSDFISILSRIFSNSTVGLADGWAEHPGKRMGVARSEGTYLRLESRLKYAEGKLWGCSMGPFGGAYMIRASLYKPVPKNFLVDDFFIFYAVLKQGFKSVVVPEAICFEHVSGSMKEEFRRKVRISTGNFQNATYYFPEAIKFWKPSNLVFGLHKVLRWKAPIVFSIIIILLGILSFGNPNALTALLITISLLLGVPLLNYLLNQLNLRSSVLQGLSYFIVMNVAMLLGFFKYLKGVRSNVWEPTKRKLSIRYDRVGD